MKGARSPVAPRQEPAGEARGRDGATETEGDETLSSARALSSASPAPAGVPWEPQSLEVDLDRLAPPRAPGKGSSLRPAPSGHEG